MRGQRKIGGLADLRRSGPIAGVGSYAPTPGKSRDRGRRTLGRLVENISRRIGRRRTRERRWIHHRAKEAWGRVLGRSGMPQSSIALSEAEW